MDVCLAAELPPGLSVVDNGRGLTRELLDVKYPHILILLAALYLSLLAACGGTEQTETSVALEPCVLSGGLAASCGVLTVPENRAQPGDKTIDVHFAVVAAQSSNPQSDPLFMLAGGPGQAAMETYAQIVPLLDEINKDRDIVLVDQRGTGESAAFSCVALEDEEEEPDLTDDEVIALIKECAAELVQKADLTQYTTDAAMRDLDAVREALAYEQINLYGASYGTRAAQAYARLFPDRLRSMILDAVTTPELILFMQMPADGQAALQILFERCRADQACHEQFPNLAEEYESLLEQLEDAPQVLQFAHPLTGEETMLTLTRERLANYVYAILYSPELVSLFPLLVHEAYETGNFTPLVAQAFTVGEGAGLNPGLLYTVTCAEDSPLIDPQEAAQLAAGTLFADRAAGFLETCEAFPQPELAADFRQPLEFAGPVLLLSGEADPVTPPKYAEALARSLPNSRHIVLPGFGHGQIAVGCMPKVIAEFLAAGSTADLDTSCLDRLAPPPFFINLSGPGP
jgi:pimeloyl-ACP methyl ester carboxylesterase